MEKNPWWKSPEVAGGQLPKWQGPVGCKDDGGGCHRGQGRVGRMIIHRAAMNKDIAGIARAIEGGENVNEVDAAGNTPLHFAAWAGDTAVAKALLDSGALINASNNAGDRPWHSAQWLNQRDMMAFLEQHGASAEQGKVIVPDHVPKVRDFFAKACWEHHPLPYEDFMEWRGREDKRIEAERKKLIPF